MVTKRRLIPTPTRWWAAGTHAERLLYNAGGVDVDASLAFFEARGGDCDCEILRSIGPDEIERAFDGYRLGSFQTNGTDHSDDEPPAAA
jgi:hypothetical protein